MIGVTLFGLFLTPLFYVIVRRLTGNSPLRHHGGQVAAPAASVISLAKSSKNLFVVWVIMGLGARVDMTMAIGFEARKTARSGPQGFNRAALDIAAAFPNKPPQSDHLRPAAEFRLECR